MRDLSSATPWRIGPLVWAGIGILTASAAALWVHYGSTVFFEMITTGFAACF